MSALSPGVENPLTGAPNPLGASQPQPPEGNRPSQESPPPQEPETSLSGGASSGSLSSLAKASLERAQRSLQQRIDLAYRAYTQALENFQKIENETKTVARTQENAHRIISLHSQRSKYWNACQETLKNFEMVAAKGRAFNEMQVACDQSGNPSATGAELQHTDNTAGSQTRTAQQMRPQGEEEHILQQHQTSQTKNIPATAETHNPTPVVDAQAKRSTGNRTIKKPLAENENALKQCAQESGTAQHGLTSSSGPLLAVQGEQKDVHAANGSSARPAPNPCQKADSCEGIQKLEKLESSPSNGMGTGVSTDRKSVPIGPSRGVTSSAAAVLTESKSKEDPAKRQGQKYPSPSEIEEPNQEDQKGPCSEDKGSNSQTKNDIPTSPPTNEKNDTEVIDGDKDENNKDGDENEGNEGGDEDEDSEDSFDETDDKLYCFCRGPNLRGMPMVECDQCGEWYHYSCIGIREEDEEKFTEELEDGMEWVCNKCQGKKFRRLKQGDRFYHFWHKEMVKRKQSLIHLERDIRRDERQRAQKRALGMAVSSSDDDSDSSNDAEAGKVAATTKPPAPSSSSSRKSKKNISTENIEGKKIGLAGRKRALSAKAPRNDRSDDASSSSKLKSGLKVTPAERRQKVRKALCSVLQKEDLAMKVEAEMFKRFAGPTAEYLRKFRVLISNITKEANPGIHADIISGRLSVPKLVGLEESQLATVEVQKKRSDIRREAVRQRIIDDELAKELNLGIKLRNKASFASWGGSRRVKLDELLDDMDEDESLKVKKIVRPQTRRLCPNCGEEDKSKKAKFCSQCGSKLSLQSPQPQPQPQPQEPNSKTAGGQDDQKATMDPKGVADDAKAKLPDISFYEDSEHTKPDAIDIKDTTQRSKKRDRRKDSSSKKKKRRRKEKDREIEREKKSNFSSVNQSNFGKNGTDGEAGSPIVVADDDNDIVLVSGNARKSKQLKSGVSIVVWEGTITRQSGPPATFRITQTNGEPFGSLPFKAILKASGRVKVNDAIGFLYRLITSSQSKKLAGLIIEPKSKFDEASAKKFSETYYKRKRAIIIDHDKVSGIQVYLFPNDKRNSRSIIPERERFMNTFFTNTNTSKAVMLGVAVVNLQKLRKVNKTNQSSTSRVLSVEVSGSSPTYPALSPSPIGSSPLGTPTSPISTASSMSGASQTKNEASESTQSSSRFKGLPAKQTRRKIPGPPPRGPGNTTTKIPGPPPRGPVARIPGPPPRAPVVKIPAPPPRGPVVQNVPESLPSHASHNRGGYERKIPGPPNRPTGMPPANRKIPGPPPRGHVRKRIPGPPPRQSHPGNGGAAGAPNVHRRDHHADAYNNNNNNSSSSSPGGASWAPDRPRKKIPRPPPRAAKPEGMPPRQPPIPERITGYSRAEPARPARQAPMQRQHQLPHGSRARHLAPPPPSREYRPQRFSDDEGKEDLSSGLDLLDRYISPSPQRGTRESRDRWAATPVPQSNTMRSPVVIPPPPPDPPRQGKRISLGAAERPRRDSRPAPVAPTYDARPAPVAPAPTYGRRGRYELGNPERSWRDDEGDRNDRARWNADKSGGQKRWARSPPRRPPRQRRDWGRARQDDRQRHNVRRRR